MLHTLIIKELKSILLGPKFVATFAVCSILILLSIFVGIQDYRAAAKQYQAGISLAEQELEEQHSWMVFRTRVVRKPDPMQVFVSGINNDIGRLSGIRSSESIKLSNSIYSDDPIFAVFRFIDLNFIVQIVLSLFAILFTYDAINGERESGTLRLAFANAVPRVKYILSKFIGSWLGLVIPLTIPILLGLLIVILFKVPLTNDHWTKVITFFGVSFLYFTFFIALGLFISSLTKRSAVSFLVLLVIWVTFVLIVPRVGVMAAGKMVQVPSIAEIEGQIDGYSKQRWDRYMDELQNIWQTRNKEMEGMTKEQREAYRDEHMWNWMQETDEARKSIETDINDLSVQLRDNLRARKSVQERLAFTFSRFSPASAYQLAAMNLASTDIQLKTRYEEAMERYRTTLSEYADKKLEEEGAGSIGGFNISLSSDSGVKVSTGQGETTLDVSDMPRFQAPSRSFGQVISQTTIDFSLLFLYSIIALAGAFVSFLRYDVR